MFRAPQKMHRGSSTRFGLVKRLWRTNFSLAGLLAQIVLVGMVTITPWSFGGVYGRAQVWLFAGAVVVLACWLIKQAVQRPADAILPTALLPLVCALGLGSLQLVPVDGKTAAVLSPEGARLRGLLLPGVRSTDASLEKSLAVPAAADPWPLSLYPASTRHDLALLLLAVTVFLAGACFFATSRSQMWLCGLIAVNGAALAFFQLVQQLTSHGDLSWRLSLAEGGGALGPFVNRNNAGGFLNLCLAGAVGLTVWAVGRSGSRHSVRSALQLPAERPWIIELAWRLRRFLANLNALTTVALSLTACIVAGILCSLSRGAAIAMVVAVMLTTLVMLLARRHSWQLWSIALACIAGLALVGWVGMSDSVQGRFASLLDQKAFSKDRIPHWRDSLQAVPDFWRLGSGLGTYRYVYGPYEKRAEVVSFYHAENQPLEALVETGVVGLALMLTMVGLIAAASWRLLRDAFSERSVAFAGAGIFALSTQAIHGFFDFGLYIPANMALFALLCGSIAGGAAQLAEERSTLGWLWLPCRPSLVALLAGLLLAASLWGLVEARRAAATEVALQVAQLPQTPTGASPGALEDAIRRLAVALDRNPDDAEAQRRTGELWVDLYRARALEQLRKEGLPDASDAQLWEFTSPLVLHRRAHQFAQHGLWAELARLRSEPVVSNHLGDALKHLILARNACPLVPEVHLLIAQLCVLAAPPADDEVHIERVRRLAPGRPDLLFQCGLLELHAGRLEPACSDWRRCLSLGPRYQAEILRLADEYLSAPQMVDKLLPDSPALLIQLVRERYRAEEQADLRRLLLRRAEDLVARMEMPEDEQCYLRGVIFALQELYPQAIENYTRAVELRSEAVRWRFELAQLLRQQGMLKEAHEQAKLCARMDPGNGAYRMLLQQINHRRLTTNTSLK